MFEKAFYGKTQIASHEDINDKDQTVKVVDSPKTPLASTGATAGALVGVALGALALGVGLVIRRRR